ncbi:hypothetical protein ACH4TV_16960 [Streptomyces sp. NPDC020898]|uniref:hypothetical protein n=1 Tax=Streptomyces sp. NPDC020898 TaxID=3365101 RepID=UPI0037A05D60
MHLHLPPPAPDHVRPAGVSHMMSHRASRKPLESCGWTLTLMAMSGAAVLLILDVLETLH